MAANTEWIMDDEEGLLELLDLYNEARAQVDAAHPRGTAQGDWLWAQGVNFFVGRWCPAHYFLIGLEQELGLDY